MSKTKISELKSWINSHGCGWNAEFQLCKRPSYIDKKSFIQFLNDHNCINTNKGRSSLWDNGTVTVKIYLDNDYKAEISQIADLEILNSKTKCALKYNGKQLGDYLFIEWLKFTDYLTTDAKQMKFDESRISEWQELFFKELESAINETTNRMTIRNKKDTIRDNIQLIENDIDIAIQELGEEAKKHDFVFNVTQNPVSSATLSYSFLKDFNILDDSPHLVIRKLKSGKYTMFYYDFEIHEATNWFTIKDGTTAEEIVKYIKKYIEPWYGLKQVYNQEPPFVKE